MNFFCRKKGRGNSERKIHLSYSYLRRALIILRHHHGHWLQNINRTWGPISTETHVNKLGSICDLNCSIISKDSLATSDCCKFMVPLGTRLSFYSVFGKLCHTTLLKSLSGSSSFSEEISSEGGKPLCWMIMWKGTTQRWDIARQNLT